MRFFSTREPSKRVSAKEAVLSALSGEAGLFMPERLPLLPPELLERMPEMTLHEIGAEVVGPFLGEEVPDLAECVEAAFSFPVPLIRLFDGSFALELFHGPSLAFKDFGARFMAQLMSRMVRNERRPLTVLVATSGDTGGAVASAFHGVPNTRVVILYPAGRVSALQERQIAGLGGNISALRVNGSFDDCQRLLKGALADQEITQKLFVTTANSINVCRLIPQAVYYFYGWSRLPERARTSDGVVFSVPSGNFGNLTAGLFARAMGLPVEKFVAATNINRTVPDYLENGEYRPRPSIATISNAMDVGDPSNFRRMLELFQGDVSRMGSVVEARSFSDAETMEAIKYVDQWGYLLDPHAAIAWLGISAHRRANAEKQIAGVFLATAHPGKFNQVLENGLGRSIDLPPELERLAKNRIDSVSIAPEAGSLKSFLLG